MYGPQELGILILMVPESGRISHYSDSGITLGIFSFCGGPMQAGYR